MSLAARKILRPVLHGNYAVRALLFAQAQAKFIPTFWRPGARLQTLCHARYPGILLHLPEPEWFRVEHLPAQALIDSASVAGPSAKHLRALWGCVPTAAALADASLANAVFVLSLGDELLAFTADDLRALDPAQCVDLDAVHWVNPPRAQEAAEITTAQINVPPAADVRAILTGNAQDPAAGDFLRRLRTGPQTGQQSPGLGTMLTALARALISALGPGKNRRNDGSRSTSPKPGILQRLGMMLLLQKMLGQQHAQFLQRMMQDLESGNWTEALKRAIPLGDLTGNGAPPNPGLWMSARQDLSWTHQAGSSFSLPPDLMLQLGQQYRQAFRALDQAGRYEEAAFVLIELLRETQEGVDYLLKHKQIRKAAELAEARGLAPAKVVHLWLLAGEPTRALRVARLTGCFEQVMPLLRDRPALAQQFRQDWAEFLLANQDYAKAVRLLWQLPQQRARAALLLETAKAMDPSLLPELLALQLCLMPEQFANYQSQLQQLLDQPDTAGCLRRESFAQTLLSYLPEAPIGLIGVALLRALMQDYALGRLGTHNALLKAIEKASNDPLWNADRSRADPISPALSFLERRECLTLDAGNDAQVALEIFDAHALRDGRYLLALGDAGVLLMHHDGRKLMHFPQPAKRLIPALAAGKYTGLWVSVHPRQPATIASKPLVELGRLDLVKMHGKSWCVTELSSFAQYAENGLWPVALGRSMMLIDLQKPGFEAFWNVTELPADVETLRLSKTELQLLLSAETIRPQHWCYRWPEMSLIQRGELTLSTLDYQLGDTIWQSEMISASVDVLASDDAAWQAQKRRPLLKLLGPNLAERVFGVPEWASGIALVQRERWLALLWSNEHQRFHLELYKLQKNRAATPEESPLLSWPIESNCPPRVDGDHANIYLSHGAQLIHIEIDSGRINTLRVS